MRPFVGSDDFINGKFRHCLWLKDASPSELRKLPQVMKRVEAVREFRLSSVKEATRLAANTPAFFMEIKQPEGEYLIIPATSSEKRDYIPLGYLSQDVIASNAANFISNATLYHFGVLTSSVHMAWMRTVCGRLEMRYRYSAAIVYNNFPWPFASSLRPPCGENANDESAKAAIEKTAQGILDARALYPDSSLADLYDPLAMPPELRKAHAANDAAVLKAYGWPTDLSEPEIVSRLFDMYEKLTASAKEDAV